MTDEATKFQQEVEAYHAIYAAANPQLQAWMDRAYKNARAALSKNKEPETSTVEFTTAYSVVGAFLLFCLREQDAGKQVFNTPYAPAARFETADEIAKKQNRPRVELPRYDIRLDDK